MKLVHTGNTDCNCILSLLEHYLSNELTVETTVDIVRHLEKCPHCLEIFKQRDRVKKRLQEALAFESAPPALKKQVSRMIRKDSGSWFSRMFGRENAF